MRVTRTFAILFALLFAFLSSAQPASAVSLPFPLSDIVNGTLSQISQATELWLNGTKAMYLFAVGKHPQNPGETWEQKFAEESVKEDLEDAWAVLKEHMKKNPVGSVIVTTVVGWALFKMVWQIGYAFATLDNRPL